jgi:hypothetical protein
MHSAVSSGYSSHGVASGFKDAHDLLARYPLKSLQKLADAHSIFQVLKQRIHRDTRSAKAHTPSKALRVAPQKR